MTRVDFDNAATTPLSTAALDAMRPHLLDAWGNPSSVHREGQRARAGIETAREDVARALGVADHEVVFTSGGTESDNLAVRGTVWLRPPGTRAHVVTTAIEHDAVLRTAKWLARREEVELTIVVPGDDGVVRAEAVIEALRPDTALVSVMHANNETGALQPVEAIGRACRERGVTFHVDAVQSLGKVALDCHALPADLVSLSAHKVSGPKGCGVLVVREGLKLQPVLTGGAQESGLRAGTENVAAIAGCARAITDAATNQKERGKQLGALTEELERVILAMPGATLNGPSAGRVPGIVNVSFEGVEGTALVHALDLRGFAVSTGSACTAGSTSPSHVLQAMGLPDGRVRGAVRFSLRHGNTSDEIAALATVLPEVLARARAHAMSS